MTGPPVPRVEDADPLSLPDDHLSVVELLNRVLDRGVVIAGEAMISVAGIDLVRLGLRLVLTSVEAERRSGADAPSADP